VALDVEATKPGSVITPVAPFRVDARRDGSSVVLVLQGEADLATGPALAEALAQASAHGTADVVLDAALLDFIDTDCVAMIAKARTLLEARGRDLVLRSPTKFLCRVLEILDMEDLVEHAAS